MQVDASQKGLGAVLYQDKGPVAYASKAMNETQQNYAQIEKELLAIVFGCKRFHQYIYGRKREWTTCSKSSPAQALMNRTLRSTLPVTPQRLTPSLFDHTEFITRRQVEQKRQKEYYDRSAQPQLPPLQEEEEVRMKKTPESPWKPATVISKYQTPRSYIVQAENGTSYRRNRRHLLKLKRNITEKPTEEYMDETPRPVTIEATPEQEMPNTEIQDLPENTKIL
ncbi:hypothetical protein QZH41_012258 [Actinostola sp. cb2023]|nr:hypothetical protein QZH41_012258 [Actinostola sp. cb2023]